MYKEEHLQAREIAQVLRDGSRNDFVLSEDLVEPGNSPAQRHGSTL